MGRRKPDGIDVALRHWAVLRRELLELDGPPPYPPKHFDRTLATSTAFLLANIRDELRDVLEVFYVATGPAIERIKASGRSPAGFYAQLENARCWLDGRTAREGFQQQVEGRG